MNLRTLRPILVAACCIIAYAAKGQVIHSIDTTVKKSPQERPAPVVKSKGPKAITHELSGGLRLNSDGISIFADIGRVKSKDARHADMFYNVRYWQIELTNKKSPKEYKSTGQGGSGNNSYVYGKINNFYALKLGRGYTKLIAGKPDPGSVSIHWIAAGGVALGILKPYYLNVFGDPNAIKYSDQTREDFLNQSVIEGSAGFGKGLSEMKFIPGGHIKTGIHFDFSANRKTLIGIETGVNFEYYSQQIQLMANQPATPYFADLYLSLQFGKRW